MKTRISIILAAILGSGSAFAENGKATIRFANNDQLSGSLEALTLDQVVWNSPILEKAQPFWLKQVMDLMLPALPPDQKAGHEATVTLTNGDSVRGQLASVTDEQITLDTWYAGRMSLNRLMVKDLRIDERPELLYRGPTGLDGWTQSAENPTWTYSNGSFRSDGPGGIARDVGLPDECRVAFDVAWRGRFRLGLVVFSDDVTSDNTTSGYEVTFNQRYVNLKKRGNNVPIGHSSNAPELQENEKAHIEIRASRKSGTVCFYVDERIVAIWHDPDFAGENFGDGIHFLAQDSSPLKISGIEVSSWNGVLEEIPEQENLMRNQGDFGQLQQRAQKSEPDDEAKEGRMILRNGDTLKGEVISIEDGILLVNSPFGEIKLPVSRLRNITLKPVSLEEPKRMNGDVRAWFPDGSIITFRVDGVENEAVKGFSQTFGTSLFKLDAFSRIEFNIYDRRMIELRENNEW